MMVDRSRWHRVPKLVVACCVMVLIASVVGAAPSPGGPTRSTTQKLAQKRYVAAGDRA
jgi:hypothetical protein